MRSTNRITSESPTILPQTLSCCTGGIANHPGLGVVRAQLIQIRRNTTPEPMPAIPIDSDCFHCRTDDSLGQFSKFIAFRLRGKTSRPFWDCPWNSDKHSRSRPTAESHGQSGTGTRLRWRKQMRFDMREALGLINSDESKSHA
jgi:hypothetical protein